MATHDSADVLSFADEVIVLQEGKIIEKGIPKAIYNNPKSKYIASLFGDVNEMVIDGKTKFVYHINCKLLAKNQVMKLMKLRF